MTLPVVPVVDTGVDDALALVVAARHPRLRLCGVICTAGNVRLDRVIANTVYVLDLLDAQVPLVTGAACRSDGADFAARGVHGPDGLAGLGPATVPRADERPGTGPAAVSPDVVVVSLGPLTSLVGLPARRIVASYARPGEANYEMDPVAAEQVSVEHVDVGPHPLRPSGQVSAGEPPGAVARLVDGLLAHQARRGVGLGDAAVLLALAEPELSPRRWEHRVRALAA